MQQMEWLLVPTEPTQKMMGRGAGAGGERLNLCMNDAAEIYRAMLAEAPEPPHLSMTKEEAATFQDWHPGKAEMLIATRFGDTNQVHRVVMPGGARTQLTFFPDRIDGASYEPTKGEFFIFTKGAGGNEFTQNYRYDSATGEVTLLTDGKSKNSRPTWSNKGDRIAYTSTRRNGADTDIYRQSPLDPKTDKLLAEVKGGGWDVIDWSPDDKQLLVLEEISINESYLWLFNAETGEKKALKSQR